MNAPSNFTAIAFFIIFIFPGIISIQVYRILMPTRMADWKDIAFLGLFYSCINFTLLSPIIYIFWRYSLIQEYPFIGFPLIIFTLFLAPIIWPILFRKIMNSERLMRGLQIQYPTAWDYYFDKRKPVFLLFHLLNGNLIGGYYGENSYAGDYPNDGDIYIEAVYTVDDVGRFGKPIPGTDGMVIKKESYTHIEFFNVPIKEVT